MKIMKKIYQTPETQIIALKVQHAIMTGSNIQATGLEGLEENQNVDAEGLSGDAKGFSFEPWDDSFEEE